MLVCIKVSLRRTVVNSSNWRFNNLTEVTYQRKWLWWKLRLTLVMTSAHVVEASLEFYRQQYFSGTRIYISIYCQATAKWFYIIFFQLYHNFEVLFLFNEIRVFAWGYVWAAVTTIFKIQMDKSPLVKWNIQTKNGLYNSEAVLPPLLNWFNKNMIG